MAVRILVAGGAGYIGSHMTQVLLREGFDVTVLDDLSEGRREAVLADDFIQGDIANPDLLDAIFKTRRISAVMHFAANIDVGESVRNPAKYFENNVSKTIVLLNSMVRNDIKRLIFSSTCSVYGIPDQLPISEKTPTRPLNPYGESKLMVERVLQAYESAYDLKSYRLRYFNACGADPGGLLGENHEPETHLIPVALRVASGRIPVFHILGDDYDTPDGTGVRDFIHVVDLCEAHALALRDLLANGTGGVLNVGIGRGFSVREVIQTVEKITGRPVKTRLSPRRPGEAGMLIADASLIRERLSWKPRFTALEDIVQHAWNWELRCALEAEQREIDRQSGLVVSGFIRS